MPETKNATSGTDGCLCCHCASSMGSSVRVQVQNVDNEKWCPRCFVWVRARMEPDRFQADQMAACQCQFCGWVAVSFGALPGQRLMCGHCRAPGAMKLRIPPEEYVALHQPLQEARLASLKDLRERGIIRT